MGLPEAERWKAIARRDWGRARLLLEHDDPEAAGFYLQQALEKFFKAFLLVHGQKPRRVHALATLLASVQPYAEGLSEFVDLCERVSAYYVISRYPETSVPPAVADVRTSMQDSLNLVRLLFSDEALA